MNYNKWIVLLVLYLSSCYSFSGYDLSPEIKTFEVAYFPVNIRLGGMNKVYDPNLGQRFQNDLQSYFQRRTPLNQVDNGGDIQFEGEITDLTVTPVAAVSGDQTAQSRLQLTVKVQYFNNFDEKKNFTKSYTEFQDFDRTLNVGDVQDELLDIMLDQMFQKIFNDSVANW